MSLCYTEYRPDIKDLGEKDAALIITQWKDYDDVRTPFGWEWRSVLAHGMVLGRRISSLGV